MRRQIACILLALTAAACLGATASAQRMPERSLVRKGNRQFARERYDLSADSYRRAMESAPGNFEATYDLGNAMVRTEQYDKAEQLLTAAAADSLQSDADRAEAYYNLGNAQFAQQKLKEALASYRRSLELNPADMEAKYNYAYTKKLLDNQNQDQNGRNDQDNGEGQDDRKDGDGDGDEQQGEGRPRSGMSQQQQEQLLDAIQAQEDKTQDKIDEKKKGILVKGRKNW